jgi:ABC-2 type transport system permease protein
VKGFVPVYKRELFALFVTPVAWVVIVAWLFLQGWHFSTLLHHFAANPEASTDGPVQAFFGGTAILYIVLLIFCSALTMRVFAEERRSGTIETLLTAPVSTTAIVLAKFLATFTVYAAMWIPTALYLVVIRKTGDIDWRVAASGYVGVMGIGSFYLAIGVLASAMTKSQILALMISTTVTMGLFIMGLGAMILEDGAARDLCSYVSVWEQMEQMSKGVVDLRRLVFDLSLTVLPLFVSVRVVDSWRWG